MESSFFKLKKSEIDPFKLYESVMNRNNHKNYINYNYIHGKPTAETDNIKDIL